MITYGVILLIAGVIAWAVGASIPNRIILIVGKALGVIGAVLLAVGLLLLVIPAGGLEVGAML